MEELLKEYFGYEKFRPMQAEIIKNVLQKRDVFVLMPTGGGKSICYQLPALKFDGLTLVISPLISLMKDQVDNLKANGIKAEYLNSSMSGNEIYELKKRMQMNEIKMLYVAPERLVMESFKEFLKGLNVSFIAIDEAHCISEWGHDFRPEYRNLKFLKKDFCDIPIIALTATATQKVRADIIEQLSLKNPAVFVSSFNRENLNLIVTEKKKSFEKIVGLLNKYKNKSAIIYCFSRRDSERLAEKLNKKGFNALPYHAGLDKEKRKLNQELFIQDRVDIIVATIAFGMGIDKPDVRLIIHHTFPKTLEGYYQEVGRAGRDGLQSDCVLFYSIVDKGKHDYFIDKIEDEFFKDIARKKLKEVIYYCETCFCRRKNLLKYFDEDFKEENCKGCDVCLKISKAEYATPEKKAFPEIAEIGEKYDAELFGQLRALRRALANRKKVPPYVIFGDVSLQEMSRHFPTTPEEFLKIKGVGYQKLEDYGDIFLKMIKEHVEKEGQFILKIFRKKDQDRKKKLSEDYKETKEMLLKKIPISEIARALKLKESTIRKHIERIADGGEKIDLFYLWPREETEKFKIIKNVFEKFGFEKLSPVYNYLNGNFSYEEIRLVKAILKAKK